MPKSPLPSAPPVCLAFIGPKFGCRHGNPGSQGTLFGYSPRSLQGGTGWCCLLQRAVTVAGCYDKASLVLAFRCGSATARRPTLNKYQLTQPAISGDSSSELSQLQASPTQHRLSRGSVFTSAHIDVAWLSAQCCLLHERKLEREMRKGEKQQRDSFSIIYECICFSHNAFLACCTNISALCVSHKNVFDT